MMNRYYRDELTHLRELGEEFAKAHPAVAPMLSGASGDPDVERLLEGVAFLTALLRQKLDDEFPELIHELVHLIWPHYLRPIPAASIVAFSPKPTLKQSTTIPAGIQLASVPVEGTSCLFKTCYPVEIHPLKLIDALFLEASGNPPAIKLSLELKGLNLSDWQPQALRIFFRGEFNQAADIYLLLRNHLRQILITVPENDQSLILAPEYLKPVGFEPNECLIPYPSHSFPGYRIIQEYFVLPEKFLFFDLVGWERWQNRGEGNRFDLTFELDKIPVPNPRVKAGDVALFATPVINIFPFHADPIRLDHRKTEYRVRPDCTNDNHYWVYSIEKVIGFVQGTARERIYVPFELFRPDSDDYPIYYIKKMASATRSGFDVFLSVTYPPHSGAPLTETLSIQLQCTNGFLPDQIRIGDICLATSGSPEYAEFKNILAPTSSILPPLGKGLLWQLISLLSLNYTSLSKPENLQVLLDLYVLETRQNRAGYLANKKRIAGIKHIETKGADRLVNGLLMRGREIRIDLGLDHFAGLGDLILFGNILDYFLGSYASLNTYTRLTIKEVVKGDFYQWPARLGDRLLI